MTEFEQFALLKEYDFASMILQNSGEHNIPSTFEKNAYYGFFLLAKYVGILLSHANHTDDSISVLLLEQRSELARSYLESNANLSNKNPFVRAKPYTVQLVSLLEDFLVFQSSHDLDADYASIADNLHMLIKRIEASRASENLLRSLDIILARRWCRILRL